MLAPKLQKWSRGQEGNWMHQIGSLTGRCGAEYKVFGSGSRNTFSIIQSEANPSIYMVAEGRLCHHPDDQCGTGGGFRDQEQNDPSVTVFKLK